MGTYFHGGNPEMETDGLHTLYLMNPNYISAYNNSATSEQQQQTATARQNMILQNSADLHHALSHSQVSHAPPPPTQSRFFTLPFAQPISVEDPSRAGNSFHYSLWGGSGGGGGRQVEVSTHPYQIQLDNSEVFRRPAAVVSPTANQQGLSLSLSSQPGRGGSGGGNGNLYNNNSRPLGVGGSGGSTPSAAQVTVAGGRDGSNAVQNYIIGSRYLKAAQELLDEVVNVGKAAEAATNENQSVKVAKMDKNGEGEGALNNEAGGSGGGSNQTASVELNMTQKQEFRMKKTKLISMLDEVEQRYRQYHHRMKTVVASFEQVAGVGSARSYTSLALRTISKQFRCLKDAIASQIKKTSKSLGEEADEDCLGVKAEGLRRLRMIDHQRAFEQLGMIQHNAWRPQRGLPERAVSVLRAWLFEHFLHPYPKDSDKHILAKQTGLTRNQVSNRFINARVRLWKPMVEEMYLEEVKDQQDPKGSNQDSSNKNNEGQDPSHKQHHQINQNEISNSTISTSPNASNFQAPPPGFALIGTSSSDMNSLLQFKKQRGAQETQNSPSSTLSAGEMSFSRQDHHQSNNLTSKFAANAADYNNSNNNDDRGLGLTSSLGSWRGSTQISNWHKAFINQTMGVSPSL